MSRYAAPAAARCEGERGTGTVGTSLGVAVFLALLLLAVQIIVTLHATSRVEAAAYETARLVATASDEDRPLARLRAAETGRTLLGQAGETADFSWAGSDVDEVVLSVSVASPGVLPLESTFGLERIERTVRLRTERLR